LSFRVILPFAICFIVATQRRLIEWRNQRMTLHKLLLLAVAALLLPFVARAQWEVEADPTAYALEGFSAHLAQPIFDGKVRVQVGIFGLDVPKFFHGNDAFTQSSRGVTLKLDYFPFNPCGGLFVGVDGDFSRNRYRLDQTGEDTRRNLVGLGPRIGYRFNLGDHFYVTPWVSFSYQFNAQDVIISGQRFAETKYRIFPAVHLGWRF
jgi:hypothetical protein